MTSEHENAMNNAQANNHTPSYPVTYQRTCPVCGERVICNMRAGQLMLDYHHDKRLGYRKWCSGSDMNLSEAA